MARTLDNYYSKKLQNIGVNKQDFEKNIPIKLSHSKSLSDLRGE
jgi:hypothetical protein